MGVEGNEEIGVVNCLECVRSECKTDDGNYEDIEAETGILNSKQTAETE
jgi:hypothetical protein